MLFMDFHFMHQSEVSFSSFQVRKAVVQGVEIMVKGTMMIGQVMGRTHLPTTSHHVTLLPTLLNLLVSEKEMGPSGTEIMAMGGSNQQPVASHSPWFLCCLSLSWSLLPPCGDSCLLQPGNEGKCLSCWVSEAHYEEKISFHLVTPAEKDETG